MWETIKSIADITDELLFGSPAHHVAKKARQHKLLRLFESAVLDRLDSYENDLRAWRLLAELYFEDGCYANSLWICRFRLHGAPEVYDATVRMIERACVTRSGILHTEMGPMVWSPIPEDIRQEWIYGDWWKARYQCITELVREPEQAMLWIVLAELYILSEEFLMGLWTILKGIINGRYNKEYVAHLDGLLELLGSYKGSGGLWDRVTVECAKISVPELLDQAVEERAEYAVNVLRSWCNLEVTKSVVPVVATLELLSTDWRENPMDILGFS